MWPFRKQTKAERVIEIMDDAVAFSSEKWTYFCKTLPFRDDVPLIDRITAFVPPVTQGLANNFEPLRGAPDGVVLLIVAKGIEASGTYSRVQIEKALGVSLPD